MSSARFDPISELAVSAAPDANVELREMTARLAADRIRPLAAHLDVTEEFPRELYQELARCDLLGITIPESLGGPGGRALDYFHVMEEISFGYASIADQVGLIEILAGLLAQHGSALQHERYLGPLLQATRFGAYGLTEAHAGSDLAAIKLRATSARDGSWILNGEKVLIHNAPIADFALVLAITDQSQGRRGLSVFVVDLDSAGVSRGSREHKMGQRASQIGGLVFDNVRMPGSALLGVRGRGFGYMMSILAKGRLGIAGLALGISRAALAEATAYAVRREAFGRPIADNQSIAFRLADCAVGYRAAFLLAEDAARRLDSGGEASASCSMAKLAASENCLASADAAVQVFGGAGYVRGNTVERLYRDARVTTIYEGTSEIQRLIISRSILPRQ
jgi:alkylation response protein AidB-like acyl-CoA dehydrogenase